MGYSDVVLGESVACYHLQKLNHFILTNILSDDTTLSTQKPPTQHPKYNYEPEMREDHERLPLPDTLIVRSSNPRDWGNLFSPPVTIADNSTSKREVR